MREQRRRYLIRLTRLLRDMHQTFGQNFDHEAVYAEAAMR